MAASKAGAANNARIATEDKAIALRTGVANFGRNMPNTAGLTMVQLESLHIANTLKFTGGNREKTAKLLGIGARTLYRKLREYGLQ